MSVDGQTKVLGIMGYPVGHTLSPEIHRYLAEICGQNTVYVPFEVAPENLKDAFFGVRAMGILGLNITVPHKRSVMQYLDETTPEAADMGAVNTIAQKDGKLIGHNTDGLGWKQSLERAGVSLQGKKAALFGAGGAARGIGVILAKSGVSEILIVNRTHEKAEELAQFLSEKGAVAQAVSADALSEIDLAVNTTKVGMLPNENDAVTQDFSFMKPDGVVCDAVYAPRETAFLKAAKEEGIKTVGGIGMLICQAVLSYEFFTGASVPKAAVDELYQRLSFEKNIILAGFMGTGKSTVGKALSRKYSLSYLDTDAEIERREGMSIPDIFAQKGETYFRDRESELIGELSKESGRVVSLGGGAVLRRENLDMLQSSGRLICLEATPETVLERVGESAQRPLLVGKSPTEVAALLEARKPYYDACREHLSVDGKPVTKIVKEIVEKSLTEKQ